MLVKLSAGDIYVAQHSEMITTVLGSCVAVCIRNRRTELGGMNHYMLPSAPVDLALSGKELQQLGYRYGDHAIDQLVLCVQQDGSATDLEAKVFGGARVLDLSADVGQANAAFAFARLRELGVAVAAQDVGLDYPRKIVFDPGAGTVKLQRLRSAFVGLVAERERTSLDLLIAQSHGKDALP